MRRSYSVLCCLVVVLTVGSPPPARGLGIDIDPLALIALFIEAGFTAPTVDWTEGVDRFDLSVIGKPVTGTGSFTTPFKGRFWSGTLTFSQADPFFDPDTFSFGGNIRHDLPDLPVRVPHPGDGLTGDIFTFSGILDSRLRDTSGQLILGRGDSKRHEPIPHFDDYLLDATITVRVAEDRKNIDIWTFELTGRHNETSTVAGPTSLILLIIGIIATGGYGWRRRHAAYLQ